MKKIALTLAALSYTLLANSYYAKVQPYEIRDISANTAGRVEIVNYDMLGKTLSKKPYVVLDDALERNELKLLKFKLEYLRSTLKQTQKILENQKEVFEKKKKNYQSVLKMSMKSQVEKDREFYNLKASEDSYLNTKNSIDNLKLKIEDLKQRKFFLEKTIKDKHFSAKGFTLYNLFVKPKQFVAMGMKVAQVADESKARLVIYLDREDLQNYKQKVIYIDGKKTSYKLSRVRNITDNVNISKYKAEIIIQPTKIFSNLVHVELKDE